MQNFFYEFGEGSSKLLLLIQDGTNTVKVNSDSVSLHFNSWKKRNDSAICSFYQVSISALDALNNR